MLARLRALPDYIRRPLRVFGMVFLGIFAVTLTGWLQDVTEWASSTDKAFPPLDTVGKAAVAAAAAGVSAVVALVVNALEDKTRFPAVLKSPASGGENPPADGGSISTGEGLVIAVVLILLLVLLAPRLAG